MFVSSLFRSVPAVYKTEEHFQNVPSSRQSTPRAKVPLPPGVHEGGYLSAPPDYPPPGLIAVRPPTLATCTRRLENKDVSLFSDIAPYLDKHEDEAGNYVTIDLECTICMDRKLITSVATHTASEAEPTKYEAMSVNPCGHFFGADCFKTWLSRRGDGLKPSCPLCRFELWYDDCEHYMANFNYAPVCLRKDQIPLTLPEGGIVRDACKWCHALDMLFACRVIPPRPVDDTEKEEDDQPDTYW